MEAHDQGEKKAVHTDQSEERKKFTDVSGVANHIYLKSKSTAFIPLCKEDAQLPLAYCPPSNDKLGIWHQHGVPQQ